MFTTCSTSYCLVTLKDLWNANMYVCMYVCTQVTIVDPPTGFIRHCSIPATCFPNITFKAIISILFLHINVCLSVCILLYTSCMTPNLPTLRSTLPSYPVANPAYHCSGVPGGVGGRGVYLVRPPSTAE
jgi:hypothetical protein